MSNATDYSLLVLLANNPQQPAELVLVLNINMFIGGILGETVEQMFNHLCREYINILLRDGLKKC
jgi:hypothetical protein